MKLDRGGKKTTQLSSLMTIIILLETLWRHTAGTAAQSCEEIKILESFKVWHAAALLKRKKKQQLRGRMGWEGESLIVFHLQYYFLHVPLPVLSHVREAARSGKKAFSFCDFWWTSLTSWRRWAYYISTSSLITNSQLVKKSKLHTPPNVASIPICSYNFPIKKMYFCCVALHILKQKIPLL